MGDTERIAAAKAKRDRRQEKRAQDIQWSEWTKAKAAEYARGEGIQWGAHTVVMEFPRGENGGLRIKR